MTKEILQNIFMISQLYDISVTLHWGKERLFIVEIPISYKKENRPTHMRRRGAVSYPENCVFPRYAVKTVLLRQICQIFFKKMYT